METKVLTAGIVGFLFGGLVVSLAATQLNTGSDQSSMMRDVSMGEMSENLKDKRGDEYDKAFIAGMIEHHEGAIEMATLAADQAKHDEIKNLAQDIISAQQKEIDQMKQWQVEWGYDATGSYPMHQ